MACKNDCSTRPAGSHRRVAFPALANMPVSHCSSSSRSCVIGLFQAVSSPAPPVAVVIRLAWRGESGSAMPGTPSRAYARPTEVTVAQVLVSSTPIIYRSTGRLRSSAGHQSRSLDLGRLGRPRRLAAATGSGALAHGAQRLGSCSPMSDPFSPELTRDRTFRRLRPQTIGKRLVEIPAALCRTRFPNVRMKLIEALGRLGAPAGARRGPCRHQTSALVQKGARRSLSKISQNSKSTADLDRVRDRAPCDQNAHSWFRCSD